MIYVHKEEWSSLQFDMDIESEHFVLIYWGLELAKTWWHLVESSLLIIFFLGFLKHWSYHL